MKIGLVQMLVTKDKAANIRKAETEIRAAAAQGAQLIVLPEMFCCPFNNKYYALYAEHPGGDAWQAMSRMASDCGVYLVAGSLPEKSEDEGRYYNTSFVFDPRGEQIARHRKLHLFDARMPDGTEYRESDTFVAGKDITLFDTPFGKIGLCICFDLRFPELCLAMALAGAQMLVAPAVFTVTTGEAHWELLLRQRAVDNQLFLAGVAAARSEKGYLSYGHSLVAHPWGTVLYQAGTAETTAVVDIDFGENEKIRAQLPLLQARRENQLSSD